MNRYVKSILQFSLSELLLLTIAASILLFLNCREHEGGSIAKGQVGVVDHHFIGIGWPFAFQNIGPLDPQEILREKFRLHLQDVPYSYVYLGEQFWSEPFLADFFIGIFILVCFRCVLLLLKSDSPTKNAGDHS